jgi:hypothetical protein
MWRRSRCSKFFNDLEVGYVGFINIACAGALNPVFGLQGYVVEHLFTVTTLLIDRSLGNSGLHRNNFFVISIAPTPSWTYQLLGLCTIPILFFEHHFTFA